MQHGEWCASSAEAEKMFNKYGRSRKCNSGDEGGPWANQVYCIKGNSNRVGHMPF